MKKIHVSFKKLIQFHVEKSCTNRQNTTNLSNTEDRESWKQQEKNNSWHTNDSEVLTADFSVGTIKGSRLGIMYSKW